MKKLLFALLSVVLISSGGAFACHKQGKCAKVETPAPVEEPGLHVAGPGSQAPDDFTACEHVTDCSIIQTTCLGPVTVSKQSEIDYLESLKSQPTIQCIRFVDPKEVCVACEEKKCKIKSWKEDFGVKK